MSEAKKRTPESAGSSQHGSSRSRNRFDFRHRHVDRITDAKKSPIEDWNHRRRLYLGLQILRIPLLIAAMLVLWLSHNLILTAIIAFISVPLPWVAVMLANEKGEARKDSEKVYKPGIVRAQRAAAAGTELGSANSPHRQLQGGDSSPGASPSTHPVINHEDDTGAKSDHDDLTDN